MTESTIAEVQQLIQQGRAAALAGDTFAARTSFRRATEIDPTCVDAWLGLSGVVPVLAEKRTYLLRALKIAPDNAEAAASLRYVEQLQSEGLQLAPSQRRAERIASGDASPLLSAPEPEIADDAVAPAIEYCYRHPDRETGLHCVSCNRPICGACAQTAPVGQLCPECRRERRPANYKVSTADLAVGGGVALLLAAVIAMLLSLIRFGGFFFIGLILGAFIGEALVRMVDRVTRAKRGRLIQIVVGAALVLGTALGIGTLVFFLALFSGRVVPLAVLPGVILGSLFNLSALVYLIALVGTAIVRLR